MNGVSYKPTPHDTLSNQKIDTDTAVAPQFEQQAQPDLEAKSAQSAAANFTRQVFDKDKVLPRFRKELSAIFTFGTNLRQVETEYQGKVQDKAINGLAKILGVRRTYFDTAGPESIVVLMDNLYQQCRSHGLKGRTSRTTEFHLLSRLLRQSDRKQASVDAKILIRAHNEEQTEQTFAEWVKKLGGLNNIKNEIAEHDRSEKQQICSHRKITGKSLMKVAKSASWKVGAELAVEDFPKSMRGIIPSHKAWRLLVIQHDDDGLTFFELQDDKLPTAFDDTSTKDTESTDESDSAQELGES